MRTLLTVCLSLGLSPIWTSCKLAKMEDSFLRAAEELSQDYEDVVGITSEDGKGQRRKCLATFFASNALLTGAHCVGSSGVVEASGHTSSRAIVPEQNSQKLIGRYDIAVAIFADNIAPAVRTLASDSPVAGQEGTLLGPTLMGLGADDTDGPRANPTSIKLVLDSRYLNSSALDDVSPYQQMIEVEVVADEAAGSRGGKRMDAGGPLLVSGQSGELVLAGIDSWSLQDMDDPSTLHAWSVNLTDSGVQEFLSKVSKQHGLKIQYDKCKCTNISGGCYLMPVNYGRVNTSCNQKLCTKMHAALKDQCIRLEM